MTVAQKPVGPVVFAIEINGQQMDEYPLDWYLEQEWGRHDLYVLTIVIPKGHTTYNAIRFWPDNAAVKITWGRAPDNVLIWYGYINDHEMLSNSPYEDHATQVCYTMIGTSKVMNPMRWKRWENTTPSGIAQTLAKKYSFRAVTTYVDWHVKYEVQAGESDFEFLNRMAQKYGYRFWVSGGTLYFIDPTVVLHGANGNYVPQYYLDHYPHVMDTIRDFCLKRGDNLPGGNVAVRKIAGIDASTNRPFQVNADGNNDASNVVMQTARHVTSKGEARRLINAQQNLSQFWMAAGAKVFGYCLLYPNKLIYAGGKALPNNYEGNWIVTGVRHELNTSASYDTTKDRYSTKVKLVKNTTDVIPRVSNYITVTPEIVQCTLVGGIWQANNQSAITAATITT